MNQVILMGRLTKNPEVRFSGNGDRQLAIARYTVAVDRRYRRGGDNGDQNTDFISCVAFDRSAEFAERYLKKGTKILVTGHIRTGSYEDRDGVRRYTTDVIVDECEFCESKGNSSSSGSGRPAPQADRNDGFMNIPDDVDDGGLPFN